MKFFNRLFVSALFIMLMVSCATAQAVGPATQATGPKENPGEDWLTGTWQGTHQARLFTDATFRFQYDPATGRISGDADLENNDLGIYIKLTITRGKQKSKNKIVFTVRYSGGPPDGKSVDFTLKRKEDGSLQGGGHFPSGRWVDLYLKKVD